MSKKSIEAPYVVSGDVEHLTRSWLTEIGATQPADDFFKEIDSRTISALEAHSMGDVIFHEYPSIRDSINTHLEKTSAKRFRLSLDRIYADGDMVDDYYDVTRGIYSDFSPVPKVMHRPGRKSQPEQLAKIKAAIGGREVVVADDVLFTGRTVLELHEELAANGEAGIVKAIAGIAINAGVTQLENAGIEVLADVSYESVIDEVCQRDFFAGVPFSGRSVFSENEEYLYSAPYLRPFGNVEGWASIDTDRSIAFSLSILKINSDMWHHLVDINDVALLDEVRRPLIDSANKTVLEQIDSGIKSLES